MPYKDSEMRKRASDKSSKLWSQQNPEKAIQKSREWRARNPKHMMWIMAKRRSAKSEVRFKIKVCDIPDTPEICPIALIPIFKRSDGQKGPCDNSPSLDRVDPNKGMYAEISG